MGYRRWNRDPRPQPQTSKLKLSKLAFLRNFCQSCIFLNWLSGDSSWGPGVPIFIGQVPAYYYHYYYVYFILMNITIIITFDNDNIIIIFIIDISVKATTSSSSASSWRASPATSRTRTTSL